jgi:hypothetical protein
MEQEILLTKPEMADKEAESFDAEGFELPGELPDRRRTLAAELSTSRPTILILGIHILRPSLCLSVPGGF